MNDKRKLVHWRYFCVFFFVPCFFTVLLLLMVVKKPLPIPSGLDLGALSFLLPHLLIVTLGTNHPTKHKILAALFFVNSSSEPFPQLLTCSSVSINARGWRRKQSSIVPQPRLFRDRRLRPKYTAYFTTVNLQHGWAISPAQRMFDPGFQNRTSVV